VGIGLERESALKCASTHARIPAQVANQTNIDGFTENNFMGPMIIAGQRMRVRLGVCTQRCNSAAVQRSKHATAQRYKRRI
jgi:hypothetical protein